MSVCELQPPIVVMIHSVLYVFVIEYADVEPDFEKAEERQGKAAIKTVYAFMKILV